MFYPPIHRIFGFIFLIFSACINIPALVQSSNLYIIFLFISSLLYFSIFIVYTFIFLRIKHYNDDIEKHLSLEFIRLIKSISQTWIRNSLFMLYYISFIGSWVLSAYLHKWYSELTIYQKTIFAYNYYIVSFSVMYLYEHKNIDKYLSLGNIGLYNEEEQLINSQIDSQNCQICVHIKTHPPIHRVLGFLLLLITLLSNIPVIFTFSDLPVLFIFIIGLIFFGSYVYYTFKFLKIRHYTDEESHHISLIYVSMIRDELFNNLRYLMIMLYYIIFISLWAFPTYMPKSYDDMTVWQKTMFTWNYTIASFTIMYLYEHKNMNKYLSMDNITIYDWNNQPINNNEKNDMNERLEDV